MLGLMGHNWITSSHMTRSFSKRSISSGTCSGRDFSRIRFIRWEVAASRLAKVCVIMPEDSTSTSAQPGVNSSALVLQRKAVAGSLIGGIAETQELLDFCGMHGITSDVEVIRIQEINEALERLLKSDVKYRFVIDMASLKA